MRIRTAAVFSALAAIACTGESIPTGPDGSSTPQFAEAQVAASKSTLAQVRKLQLSSRSIILDGTAVPYTVKLFNPTSETMSEVWYQVIIEQGANYRGGGGSNANCTTVSADLPPGTCTMDFGTSANNELPGEGTLVPGPADLVLTLHRGYATPVVQDVETVRVILVAP
jgi:hypothetical protein